MEFLDGVNGVTVALVIFGLFLLVTGLLVGSILMALKRSKSRKVDDLPEHQPAEFQRDVEPGELEKTEKDDRQKPQS